MVSSTFCPAVHILGSQNVNCRAEGIADHYWPWAIFLVCNFSKEWVCCTFHAPFIQNEKNNDKENDNGVV